MRYIKKNNISHFLSLQKKRKKEINKEVSTKNIDQSLPFAEKMVHREEERIRGIGFI